VNERFKSAASQSSLALSSKLKEESGAKAAVMIVLLLSSGVSAPLSIAFPIQILIGQIGGPALLNIQGASLTIPDSGTTWIANLMGPSSSPPLFAMLPQVWSDSAKKRSRLRICVEILELLKQGPLSPFEVAFQLRLNSKRTKMYLEFLKQQKSLESIEQDGRVLYRLTPAGMALIERAKAVLFLDR